MISYFGCESDTEEVPVDIQTVLVWRQSGIGLGSVYALLALSFTVVYSQGRLAIGPPVGASRGREMPGPVRLGVWLGLG
jgi:hypothetical protein